MGGDAAFDALSLRASVSDPAPVGRLLSPLPPGPCGRWDEGSTLELEVDGATLASASTAAGAGAGAAVVLLLPGLARGRVAASELRLPLIWRAGAAGAPGMATSTTTFTWTGIAYRPFAPARLSAALRDDGGIDLAWIRRTRLHGDSWDAEEVPVGEEREAYLAEVLAGDGATVLRAFDVDAPSATYAASAFADDFPAGVPGSLILRVRQRSAVFGLGAALQQTLWL